MALMIFIFLCFIGLFVMFYFILHGQEKLLRLLREEVVRQRTALHAMEKRLAVFMGDADAASLNAPPDGTLSPSSVPSPAPQSLLPDLSNRKKEQRNASHALEIHLD